MKNSLDTIRMSREVYDIFDYVCAALRTGQRQLHRCRHDVRAVSGWKPRPAGSTECSRENGAGCAVASAVTPVFSKPAEQRFAQTVVSAIGNHEDVPSSEYLLEDDTIAILVKEAEAIYAPGQDDLPGINEDSEYIPDFVTETNDTIYMIETKAANEIASPLRPLDKPHP
jgi:hypothetical protein